MSDFLWVYGGQRCGIVRACLFARLCMGLQIAVAVLWLSDLSGAFAVSRQLPTSEAREFLSRSTQL